MLITDDVDKKIKTFNHLYKLLTNTFYKERTP